MSKVKKHFDKVSESYDSGKRKYGYYYDNLKKLLSGYIPKNKKVFEVGCGTGELLASLKPSYGYGMDISPKMVKIASKKFSKKNNLTFSTKWPKNKYDFIFMSDVIEHLEKPEETLSKIRKCLTNNGIFINTNANPKWETILMFWEKLGWKMEEGPHDRIVFKQFEKLLKTADFKVIEHDFRLLIPVNIPLLTKFVNRYLEKYLKKYAFIEYVVAQKA